MFDRKNLLFLAAGAGLAYAYSCYRDKQGRRRYAHRPHESAAHHPRMPARAPGYAPGLPAPQAAQVVEHPRQRGFMDAGGFARQSLPSQPAFQTGPSEMPYAGPPPAGGPPPVGMGAPPAGEWSVPSSHDAVMLPQSPHARGRAMAPPPPPPEYAGSQGTSENFFDVGPGIGPVELEGF